MFILIMFLDPEIFFMAKKCFWPKFWFQILYTLKTFLDQKCLWTQNFWSKPFWDKKFLWTQNFYQPKFSIDPNFCRYHKILKEHFLEYRIFWPKFFWKQNFSCNKYFLWSKNFWPKIFEVHFYFGLKPRSLQTGVWHWRPSFV